MDKNIENMVRGFIKSAKELKNNTSFNEIVNHGQKPHTFMISCCDSRISPVSLFNNDFGDIFELRTIANIIPPYRNIKGCTVAATIEFVLQNLSISNVVILGHSNCAGINCLYNIQDNATNIVEEWLEPMCDANNIQLDKFPTKISAKNDQHCLKTLKKSKENLMKYPKFAETIEAKDIAVHVWFYDMTHKDLYSLEENSFVCISGEG